MINDDQRFSARANLNIMGALPSQASYAFSAIGCTNPDCKRFTAEIALYGFVYSAGQGQQRKFVSKRLLPTGACKPQPEYIPRPLVEDYEEACAIKDDSPKAAATLVRRCLQGMIRDFCTIKGKGTLAAEIRALRKLVDEGHAPRGVSEDSVDAIEQVKGIGNIGAHMEEDINLIVEVDADEAQMLISLVEMLFEEWYVARYERLRRLEEIKQLAAEKQAARIPQSSAIGSTAIASENSNEVERGPA